VSEDAAPTEPERQRERPTSQVELLWDLVFVFAVTQVAALIAHRPSVTGFGQAMLLLALVWWAWSAFVWAANAHEAESRTLRACLLAGTVLIFIAGLALPRAFTSESLTFAVAYVLVRSLHLAAYADASRRGNASWSSIAGFAVTVVVGMALLLAGASTSGPPRTAAWLLAVAIDYAGPAWLTRDRLRGLQQVAVAHFAERFGAFVIICLGESVVAIGVGGAERPLTAELAVGATLGLAIGIGMWWTYFDRLAERARAKLGSHPDPVIAAADAYSYLHLLIVAGIITFAGGVRLAVRGSAGAPLAEPGRLAICGGVALYLLGVAAFRLRLLGERSAARLLAAGALAVLFLAGGGLPAWGLTAAIAAVVGVMCALESLRAEADETEGPEPRAQAAVGGAELVAAERSPK
jgi:low temperature requirement protein LtrA